MKGGLVLVNCACGELMNIPEMIEDIESEKIGALALNVFENEKGIYHDDRRTDIINIRNMADIWQFPNVILTHHIAFYTDAAVVLMVRYGIEGLVSLAIN